MSPNYIDKLRGKSLVIVGGTSGVGFAVAVASLEFGAKVVVVSRTQGATNVRGIACDLSSEQAEKDLTKVFDFATDNGINLVDHVVSTAGGMPNPITLAEVTSDDLVAASKYHFIGDLILAKVAVKYLKQTYTS
ncbi:short chain dehydrogenase [Fonsecaea pedrosoi]|nr:short chain dehydrogenase [Fonsecaea pedrosoi]